MFHRPYGPTAWLIAEIDEPLAWAAGLVQVGLDGVLEIVPAKETVLVITERSAHDRVGQFFSSVSPIAQKEHQRQVDIDVVYDGDDLDTVAEQIGISVNDVIERHSAASYRAAFCGFSPGFAYLDGLDETLRIPRRDRPRTKVPAGSVAIAADYSCIYPSMSPGGWHLLGTTTANVWNADRKRPALLVPGTVVRFNPVRR